MNRTITKNKIGFQAVIFFLTLGTILASVIAALAGYPLTLPTVPHLNDESLTTLLYLMAAVATGYALVAAFVRTSGPQRIFWGLFGGGLILHIVADLVWSSEKGFGLADPYTVVSALVVGVSYPLMFAALVYLVSRTTLGVVGMATADVASVMLALGMVVYYFAVGSDLSNVSGGPIETAAVLCGVPLAGGLLVFGALAGAASNTKPPFVDTMNNGFVLLVLSDVLALFARFSGQQNVVDWTALTWILGILFFGIAARKIGPELGIQPTVLDDPGVDPAKMTAFFLGPLSPATLTAFIFVWDALLNPDTPLPPFVQIAGALVAVYFAGKICWIMFLAMSMLGDRDAAIKRLERTGLSMELHDRAKQTVYSAYAFLRSAQAAREKGNDAKALALQDKALEAVTAAHHQLGEQVTKLGADAASPAAAAEAGAYGDGPEAALRDLKEPLEKDFSLRVHEDRQVVLDGLRPGLREAAHGIAREALWNAAKHSRARNVWMETRREGASTLLRVRDDGVGFSPDRPGGGSGLSMMRSRAEQAGARLDVISAPGAGTTVELRMTGDQR